MSPPATGIPDHMQALPSELPEGTVGEEIAEDLRVRVLDRFEDPVPDVSVEFSVEAGGGSLERLEDRTDSEGYASAGRWILGTTPGLQRVAAVVPNVSPVVFETTAHPGPPDQVSLEEVTLPEGTVGEVISDPAVVVVRDRFGNPTPQVTVRIRVTRGGGQVSPTEGKTDAQGRLAIREWTLGTVPGPQELSVEVEGVEAHNLPMEAAVGLPDHMQALPSELPEGTVGEEIGEDLQVRVLDRFENPVPQVSVEFSVEAGGGSLERLEDRTDSEGYASAGRWILGTVRGHQRVAAAVPNVAPVFFETTARPGPPDRVELEEVTVSEATVGEVISDPAVVVVRDWFGNSIPHVTVRIRVTRGGGQVSPTEGETDDRGRLAIREWTLGTVPGPQELTMEVEGVEARTLSMEAAHGEPALLERVSTEQQSAEVGAPVPDPPAVRLLDEYGNPVPGESVLFVVTTGGGSVQGASGKTDAAGFATMDAWTLGPVPGPNVMEARRPPLDPVVFTAEAISPSGFNLFVEAVHLNQSNQTFVGDIGGIAGRPGVLRVVVRANGPNSYSPRVRLRLFQGGNLLREVMISRFEVGVPTNPDLNVLSDTWNLKLSAAEVVEGLAVEALVDPDNEISETSESDNVLPRGGGALDLDVQPIFDLNMVWIPIEATVNGTKGSITSANTESFLRSTRQWIPSAIINSTVQAAFTTGEDLRTEAGWRTLLSDIQAKRTAENATDQYYHGIIGDFSGIAYGGLAYVLGAPSSLFRSALSYDRQPFSPGTIAHELGHNLGRRHSPCGDPSGVDPDYPHPDAVLGHPGWDILSSSLIDPNEYRDFMSYCRPRWTSDYTWAGTLEWRRADPWGQQASGLAAGLHAAQVTTGLLLWGRITDQGVILNPSFTLTSRPVLPETEGPHEMRGVAVDGQELFRFSFAGVEVADGAGPMEQQFAFFVPMGSEEIDLVERIEVFGPRGRAARVLPQPLVGVEGLQAPPPELRLDRLEADRVGVQWDPDLYPMALVREGASGRILSFMRDGAAVLHAPDVDHAKLEVLLSDGVRSRVVWPR